MTGRYSNYMYDGEDSFMTMIESLIQNPVYAVQQSFTQEKLIFILQIAAALGIPSRDNEMSKTSDTFDTVFTY